MYLVIFYLIIDQITQSFTLSFPIFKRKIDFR